MGNVSALAGLRDDSRYLQISAPVQPGNSGGPLLDASGHLIGIVTAKLDAIRYARITGDIPQNVNFALKAEVARTFLDSKGISYRIERSELQLAPADVGDNASPFTVYIECRHTDKDKLRIVSPSPTSPPGRSQSTAPAPAPIFSKSNLMIYTQTGVRRFTVELALTGEEWNWGLHHSIPFDAGRLYIYRAGIISRDPRISGWVQSMRTTSISLDVLFVGSDERITEIFERRMPNSEDINSKLPAVFMLEVNGGAVQRFGIKIGDVVRCSC